jgi:hypothetical protein
LDSLNPGDLKKGGFMRIVKKELRQNSKNSKNCHSKKTDWSNRENIRRQNNQKCRNSQKNQVNQNQRLSKVKKISLNDKKIGGLLFKGMPVNLSGLEKLYPMEQSYTDSLNLQLLTWMNRHFLREEREFDSEHLIGLFRFAPRLLPFAGPRIQLLAAKLFTLLFIMDDRADKYPGNLWKSLWEKHLAPKHSPVEVDLIALAMEPIQLLNLHKPKGSASGLLMSLKEFVYAGMEEKEKWKDHKKVDLELYFSFKIKSSGINIAFDCLLIAHPELQTEIPAHALIKIKRRVARCILLSNDLDSFEKELRAGDLNNLVILFHQKQGIPLRTAVNKVVHLLKDELWALESLFQNELFRHINVERYPDSGAEMEMGNGFIQSFMKIYSLYLGCKFWALEDTDRYKKS